MVNEYTTIIASLLAVIVTFLFSVEKFSRQAERLAGDKFKDLLQRSTDKKFKSIFVGTFVTSILQSSTAVSVLVVSLAGAGILPLFNSLGVIIGANIGTTITTQLVAFKILTVAPYILIFGYFLTKIKNRFQVYGKTVFYFGLLFSCLLIVSVITREFADNRHLLEALSHTSNLFWAIIVGFVITNILQSSTLTTSIIVILASQGVLTLEQALGIILGTNIGTTTTALIASLAMGKAGKQVAVGHFLFNFVGVIIFIPFISLFMEFITTMSDNLTNQVALSHTFFNVFVALVFFAGFNFYYKAVLFVTKKLK
jgi:phosphate:Na+ symporter